MRLNGHGHSHRRRKQRSASHRAAQFELAINHSAYFSTAYMLALRHTVSLLWKHRRRQTRERPPTHTPPRPLCENKGPPIIHRRVRNAQALRELVITVAIDCPAFSLRSQIVPCSTSFTRRAAPAEHGQRSARGRPSRSHPAAQRPHPGSHSRALGQFLVLARGRNERPRAEEKAEDNLGASGEARHPGPVSSKGFR